MRSLSEQVQKLATELATSKQQAEGSRNVVDSTRDEAHRLEQQLRERQQELELQLERQERLAEQGARQIELKVQETQLKLRRETQEELLEAQQEAISSQRGLQDRVDALVREAAEQSQGLRQAEAQLAERRQEVQELNRELKTAGGELARVQQEHDTARAAHREAEERAKAGDRQVTELQRQAALTDVKADSLKAAADAAKAEVERLRGEAAELGQRAGYQADEIAALKEALRHGNDEASKAEKRDHERLQEDVHRLDRQLAETALARDAAQQKATDLADALRAKSDEAAALGRGVTKAESEAALAQAQLATQREQVGELKAAVKEARDEQARMVEKFGEQIERAVAQVRERREASRPAHCPLLSPTHPSVGVHPSSLCHTRSYRCASILTPNPPRTPKPTQCRRRRHRASAERRASTRRRRCSGSRRR